MEWLLIAGLGVWLWLSSQKLRSLSDKLDRLEDALGDASARGSEHARPVVQARQSARAGARSVLRPQAAPVNEDYDADLEEFAPPRPVLLLDQPVHADARPVAAAEAPARARRAEKWLAENGMAWLGGGALALGGAFLVAYAAQSGWFTPAMRLAAAALAGLIMIGAGEWARRAGKGEAHHHPLAGALMAGAGAATLYAVAWAAHGLYGFIDWSIAALALTACAALLLGLSFVHGQPLGALAIAAAFIAPLLTAKGAWPESALTLYLLSLVAAGCAVAALRAWTVVAGAALFCAYLWFSVSLADDAHVRATLLLAAAALGACALALRPSRAEADVAPDWSEARAMAPSIGVVVSAVLVAFDWAAIVSDADANPLIAAPALTGIGIVGLAALARRARLIDPLSTAGAIVAMPLGFFIFALLRSMIAPISPDFAPWALAAAGAAGLAGLFANPHGRGRALIAAAGAGGALALLLLAANLHGDWSAIAVWAPLGAGSALLCAAAFVAARSAPDANGDLGVDIWAGAAGLCLLMSLNALAPGIAEPMAAGAAALAFASVFVWRGWRIWPIATAGAGAAALAYALSDPVFGAAMRSEPALWQALFAMAVTGLNLFAAAALLRRRRQRSNFADAVSAGGVIACVIGAYLGLNWFATGGAGAALDGFTRHALNALMLIVAGYVSSPRVAAQAGWITRWRGHVLLGAGLSLALAGQGLTLNPWWGEAPAALNGPPLINALAIAFAAPALLMALNARRYYAYENSLARFYAGAAGVLAALWAVMEIRRGFHGPLLASGGVELVECHIYGLAALAAACVLARLGRGGSAARPFSRDAQRAAPALAWIGVLAASYVMLVAGQSLFGWRGGGETGSVSTAIVVAQHAGAAFLCALLGGLIAHPATRRMCALGACAFAFWCGVLAIRWAHHQGAMDDGGALIGLEALAYALWPLAFVHAGLWIGRFAVTRGALYGDYAWVFARAAWPALMWAGLGLLLLFPPWWGLYPAHADSTGLALAGLGSYALAAWLSARGNTLSGVAGARAFAMAGGSLALALVFAAQTLIVRRAFHGADMATELADAAVETWTYSAAWAVFGAAALGLGLMRASPVLRWGGIIVLLATTLKVLLVDMAALDGFIRAASFLGLGAVLVAAALAARRIAPRQKSHS